MMNEKAENDALFMKQYCCKFHNETICVECHTFNVKGLVHCVRCGAARQREPSKAKGTFITVQDQIEFTNTELRPLVYKMNPRYRGKVTDGDAQMRARARKHLKRARKGTEQIDGTHRAFNSVVERWDNDEKYRTQLETEEHLTRDDALRYDYLASLPAEEIQMSRNERQSRMRNHAWDVVQGEGGGRHTIKTTLYPSYAAKAEAKASTPPQRPSSSSSSWNQQWWSSSSTQPPWKREGWWQKRW